MTLRQREYDIIHLLSEKLGVTKTDLILTAIKKQYSRTEIQKDYLNDYVAMLKRQIEEYEKRIAEEQKVLNELKDEYAQIVSIRTGGDANEKD